MYSFSYLESALDLQIELRRSASAFSLSSKIILTFFFNLGKSLPTSSFHSEIVFNFYDNFKRSSLSLAISSVCSCCCSFKGSKSTLTGVSALLLGVPFTYEMPDRFEFTLAWDACTFIWEFFLEFYVFNMLPFGVDAG